MAKAKFCEGKKFVSFHCHGCKRRHMVCVEPFNNHPGWGFNGDMERPTITPSILCNPGGANPTEPVCHSFVTDGKIQFLGDCTHELAGQTVELEEI